MKTRPDAQLTWHEHPIRQSDRERLNGHPGAVIWFTGLSGSGKSTLAGALEAKLHREGFHTYLLDGDNIRHRLNRDLGFSAGDRAENIRRVAEVAALFCDAGILVLTAFISPFRRDRALARQTVAAGRFLEVYVRAGLETCEQRDPKGLYRQARQGKIRDFTGIDSPYEEPGPEALLLDTERYGVVDCRNLLRNELQSRGFLQYPGKKL